jgi:predicted DCC family thiol-disulfide oxidoreductase YuxK
MIQQRSRSFAPPERYHEGMDVAQYLHSFPGSRDLLLYDGECGLCSVLAGRARAIDRDKRFTIVAYQDLPEPLLRRFGLDHARCSRRLYSVSPGDRGRPPRVRGGAFAVNDFLWKHPPWSAGIVLLYAVPLLLLLEVVGYHLVSANRHRISALLGIRSCRRVPPPS